MSTRLVGWLVGACMVLPVVAWGVWLLIPRPFETLTTERDRDTVHMIDSHGHRISGNRYTMTFHDGDRARCRVRRFPIVMHAVIEECKPRANP
jgi:hypothetical protein